jgi:hypothetical protein
MSSTALIPVAVTALGDLAPVAEQAREYARRAKSPATQLAYRNDWRDSSRWCEEMALTALPATPETVGMYIASLASHCKAATITRRLSGISQPRGARVPFATQE